MSIKFVGNGFSNGGGELPPVLLQRLLQILDDVRIAAPSERLQAFTMAARRIAGEIIGPHYSKRDAGERLENAAHAFQLIETFGDDVVQFNMAAGLADPLYPVNDELDALALRQDERAKPIAIRATPFVWREPGEIEPRRWLYGRILLRRCVTATVAPGGAGKSSLNITEALAIATGRNLLSVTPAPGEPINVWYWNLEEPRDAFR